MATEYKIDSGIVNSFSKSTKSDLKNNRVISTGSGKINNLISVVNNNGKGKFSYVVNTNTRGKSPTDGLKKVSEPGAFKEITSSTIGLDTSGKNGKDKIVSTMSETSKNDFSILNNLTGKEEVVTYGKNGIGYVTTTSTPLEGGESYIETIEIPSSAEADLNITYSELEANIETIKKVVAQLKNAWETETKNNLTKLENSWVGNDCKEYITKLNKMDKKMENTIAALELLGTTYEQAKDIIKQNQAQAMNQIANIY